jgi:hypothetical protein
VAISPRIHRQERIAQLELEIASILEDHRWMPPCCAQDAHDSIDEKRAEIARLNEPHVFERPTGQTFAYIAGGSVCALGLLFESYGTFTFGILIFILSALGAARAPKR